MYKLLIWSIGWHYRAVPCVSGRALGAGVAAAGGVRAARPPRGRLRHGAAHRRGFPALHRRADGTRGVRQAPASARGGGRSAQTREMPVSDVS